MHSSPPQPVLMAEVVLAAEKNVFQCSDNTFYPEIQLEEIKMAQWQVASGAPINEVLLSHLELGYRSKAQEMSRFPIFCENSIFPRFESGSEFSRLKVGLQPLQQRSMEMG